MLLRALIVGVLVVVAILTLAQAITVIAPYLAALIVLALLGWFIHTRK